MKETGNFTMGAVDFEENWFQFPADELEAALAEQRDERRLTAELAASSRGG